MGRKDKKKTIPCPRCKKFFVNEYDLFQHETMKHFGGQAPCGCHNTGSLYRHFKKNHAVITYDCSFCSKVFVSNHSRETHQLSHNTIKIKKPKKSKLKLKTTGMSSLPKPKSCSICNMSFPSKGAMRRHKRVEHSSSNQQSLNSYNYLEKYYREKVIPTKEDTKKSKAFVKGIIEELLQEVRRQDGGRIYSALVQGAGSSSTNTKVNNADEFDFELPLNVDNFKVSYKGITYDFEDSVSTICLMNIFSQ